MKAHLSKVGNDTYRDAIEWLARQRAPLSTSQLAGIIGLSISFIRTEIRLGELKAVRIGRGRKPTYRIPFAEAMRYARRLGLPQSSPAGYTQRIDDGDTRGHLTSSPAASVAPRADPKLE